LVSGYNTLEMHDFQLTKHKGTVTLSGVEVSVVAEGTAFYRVRLV